MFCLIFVCSRRKLPEATRTATGCRSESGGSIRNSEGISAGRRSRLFANEMRSLRRQAGSCQEIHQRGHGSEKLPHLKGFSAVSRFTGICNI